jgi:hypothetical protein
MRENIAKQTQMINAEYCGVMKFLADMPPCLGGGDHGINVT